MQKTIARSLHIAARCLTQFLNDQSAISALETIAERMKTTYQNGGKVLIAGNGGSMTDAMHFAEELTGKFRGERKPLPALALSDVAHMSCVSNDYGFDHVFSRMIEAFATPHDLVILLSTSGNSPNLILAAQEAKNRGAFVAGFLGRGGGQLKNLCDCALDVPGETSDRIQELHMMCLHILIEAVEIGLELAPRAE